MKKKQYIVRRKKHYKKKCIIILVLIGAFLGMGLSIYKINIWILENISIDKQIEQINELTLIEEMGNTSDVEYYNPPTDNNELNDYWTYVRLPLLKVDFSKIKELNNDTVGLLRVNGMSINYPVVQTTDNDYYLKHDFNKNNNSSGWVFMDYRNDIDNLQNNTIIYAHGRINKTMFGPLKYIFDSNWYENTDVYTINLVSEHYSTLWQIFSVYDLPTETYYLTSNFASNESYQRFLDTITSRSKLKFNYTIDTNDKILTLSTCFNKTDKLVVHAKLIKRQVIGDANEN